MQEVIVTGKTVEEATEAGCAELGLSREQVSVEILEMPVKKIFKTLPAKVKVTSILADEPVSAVAAAPAPAPAASKPVPEVKPTRAEISSNKPTENKKPSLLQDQPEEEISVDSSPAVQRGAEYLESIFRAAGAGEMKITAARQGDATLLRVDGESIQSVIDTKGDVIQALSYLTDRAVNKGVDKKDGEYLRVRLDVAGYRNRREDELLVIAQKCAKEVLASHRSKTLPPMNPYERLIVHTAISEIDGLVSESIGSDTERRVVIKSTASNATDGEDWNPKKKDNYRSGAGGGNRGGRGGRDNRSGGGSRDNRSGGRGDNRGGRGDRPQNRRNYEGGGRPQSSTPEREYANRSADPDAKPVVPERREAVRDGDDLPLYGKIEL